MPFDYKDNYHRELEHRNQLRAAVSTPVVILTLVGSVIGFMVQRYRFTLDLPSATFAAFVLTSILGIAVAAFYLARVIHGHTYKHIECAMRLREHHNALRNWHAQYGSGPAAADDDFDEYLEESYARAGDHNARLNASRSASLFIAHRAMIFSAIFAGGAFLPFWYGSQVQDEQPVLVRLVDRSEGATSKEISSMAEEQKPAPQEPVPPKPEGPPLRDAREDHHPREKK